MHCEFLTKAIKENESAGWRLITFQSYGCLMWNDCAMVSS